MPEQTSQVGWLPGKPMPPCRLCGEAMRQDVVSPQGFPMFRCANPACEMSR